MEKIKIMDCTLRDGSYAIDFQFDKKQTSTIVKKLSKANVSLIEVGHGIGLGASRIGLGKAACSDEEYFEAASSSITGNSKWGVFCIPGISTLEDLNIASNYNIDFIRIGSDVMNIKSSKKFIEFAKSKGIKIFANFMKSYNTSPKNFAKLAKESLNYGSDVIYIVDSCGGMFPDQLKNYISETLHLNPLAELGFHGHNNLGLGMANCLVSIEGGVKYIDSTLQCLGRSAGNVSTEHLVCVLEKKGLIKNINPIEIMDIGESDIRPLISERGLSSLDISLGWTLTHSGHMPRLSSFSQKNNLDPRKLVKFLNDFKINNFEEKNLLKVVNKMKNKIDLNLDLENWPTYFGKEEEWEN